MESNISQFQKVTNLNDNYPHHFLRLSFPFDAKLEADTLRKILSFAIALAKSVLPVPGGPNSSMPLVALLIP